jgi:hypothetical protein
MTLPHAPRHGERVRVDSHDGNFIVVRIDKISNVAKVELWDDPAVTLWDVPFRAIHLVREPESEAA